MYAFKFTMLPQDLGLDASPSLSFCLLYYLSSQVDQVDAWTKLWIRIFHSFWDLVYVALSMVGLVLSTSCNSLDRNVCYALCLLDLPVRLKTTERWGYTNVASVSIEPRVYSNAGFRGIVLLR